MQGGEGVCRVRVCRVRVCRIRVCRVRVCRICVCRIRVCRIGAAHTGALTEPGVDYSSETKCLYSGASYHIFSHFNIPEVRMVFKFPSVRWQL